MALVPGMVLGGDFRVDSRLGVGGMGEVWLAEQLSLGRKRAIKVIRGELDYDPKMRERFAQEARIGATIESDHVVEVVAAGIDEKLGVPWLAMELLEGRDLETTVVARGGLPWGEVALLAAHLGHALSAAHAVGVVHRDLKPENIFLARSRRVGGTPFDVKVLDFGLAKLVEGVLATSSQSTLIGTPLFMAPEQAEASGPATSAIDVWALGLIVYRALTGRYFWRSAREGRPTITSVMREVLFDPIPAPSARAAEDGVALALPPDFDAWFARCTTRDPKDRMLRADEACAALGAALEGATVIVTPPSRPPGASGEPPASSVNVPAALLPTMVMAPSEVALLFESPTFSFGRLADVFVIRWWLCPTLEAVEEMDRVLSRAEQTMNGRQVILPVVDTSVPSPSGDVREALQDVIKRHDRAVQSVAYVVLGSGFHAATLRAIMTGMVLAKRPQHSTTVHSSTAAAIASLEVRRGRPDTPGLIAAIDRFVARKACKGSGAG